MLHSFQMIPHAKLLDQNNEFWVVLPSFRDEKYLVLCSFITPIYDPSELGSSRDILILSPPSESKAELNLKNVC